MKYDAPVIPEWLDAREGEPFIVPKGTVVHTTHPQIGGPFVAARTTTVTPVSVVHGLGHPPATWVRWAGAGGYWKWVEFVR